jgi:hypothetical protein
MKVWSVTYDLSVQGGQDYDDLIEVLKSFPSCPLTKSAWLLATPFSATQIQARLKRFLSAGDELSIVPVAKGQGWAASGLTEKQVAWLRRYLAATPTPPRVPLSRLRSLARP